MVDRRPPQIIKYDLVHWPSVNAKIAEGWQPHGSAVYVPTMGTLQPMVLYAPPKQPNVW